MHNGVLVAGMHRSGTSAMTRILNLLGCTLPQDLIPAGLGNERGHWESSIVVALNDQILAAAGSCWDDWVALNPDWRASPLRDDAVLRASEIVRQHSEIGEPFVIKDPRISKIADVWLDAFDAANISPALVIMLRNPSEVAASLESRDLMQPAYGHLLWLRHMLDVELHSRGRKRAVCRFDTLLENWPGLIDKIKVSTGIYFPRNSPLAHSEIDQFLDAHSRRHISRPELIIDNPGLSVWLRRAYAVFLRWSEEGESRADFAELDAIRGALDESAPAFSRLILPGTQSETAGAGGRLKLQLEEQLDQARLATEAADRVSSDVERQRLEAEAREVALLSQIEEMSRFSASLEAEVVSLREEAGRVAELASKVEQFELHEGESIPRIAQLEELIESSKKICDFERDARTQAELELDKTQGSLSAAREELADVASRLSVAESALAQRREELSQIWAELEAARAVVAEVNDLRTQLQIRDDRLNQANDWVFRLAAEREAAQKSEKVSFAELKMEMRARSAAEAQVVVLSTQLNNLKQARDEGVHRVEAARDALEHQLVERLSEIANLTKLLNEATTNLGDLHQQPQIPHQAADELVHLLQIRDEEVGAAEVARGLAERRLAEHFSEMGTLTKLLRDASSEADASKVNSQWLRQVNAVSSGFPRWWALMPTAWRRRREHSRYARLGLFNAEKYLQIYSDVAESGMDPLRHFILHGMDENRINPI